MEIKSREKEVEFKATVDDEGRVVLKRRSKVVSGRRAKAQGSQFEARVRKDLEGKGWVVDKWSNNVSLGDEKIVPCKRVFRPIGGGKSVMTIGTGFPDFVAFDRRDNLFEVIGVEVKMNGRLSREEKLKCDWLLKRGIFGQILVASKVKEGRGVRVVYEDFLEVLGRMRKEK